MKNNYVLKTLSNGVKVYFYSDKNCKQVFASYNVKYGHSGYYDEFYYKDKAYHLNPAMAHFLEHYLIEKSKRGNMLHRFRDKNYDFNGLTGTELTTFYFKGIKGIEESLEDLIYMVDDPEFNKDAVEEVKSAIIEELRNISDGKYQIAFANNRRNAYSNFDAVPIGNNALGSTESTSSITLEDALNAYGAYYNNDNKFLVIGGNVDIDETLILLEKIYSKLDVHPNEMKPMDYGNDFSLRKEREVIELRGDQDFAVITYKIRNDFNMPPLKIDAYISMYLNLKISFSTEFIQDLIKKKILVDGVGYTNEFWEDVITISIYGDFYDVEAFERELEKELNLENLDEEEFELIKKSMIVSELRKKDYIYNCFRTFGKDLYFTQNIDEVDMFSTLTIEELKEVIGKIKFDTKTVTIITNKK